MTEAFKPDRNDSPRFFIGAKVNSGANFNYQLKPCFSKKTLSNNLESKFSIALGYFGPAIRYKPR